MSQTLKWLKPGTNLSDFKGISKAERGNYRAMAGAWKNPGSILKFLERGYLIVYGDGGSFGVPWKQFVGHFLGCMSWIFLGPADSAGAPPFISLLCAYGVLSKSATLLLPAPWGIPSHERSGGVFIGGGNRGTTIWGMTVTPAWPRFRQLGFYRQNDATLWCHGIARQTRPTNHGTLQQGNIVNKTMFLLLCVFNQLQSCGFRWISVAVPWERNAGGGRARNGPGRFGISVRDETYPILYKT